MNSLNIFNVVRSHSHLLVAFSGGLDSTVLLHQLVTLREKLPNVKIRAVHINHNFSINANKWVIHCQSLCAKWNVPLLVEQVKITSKKLGIEGQARKERHIIFKKVLIPGETLVTAHHLDDQSETFLLALKRGSGPTGLSAMPVQTTFDGIRLLRPFLKIGETRVSLLQWAKVHNLNWIDDESNKDDNYDRNFLRLRILPLITQRWSYFSKSVTRSASLCAEQENLLDELLINKLTAIMTADGTLSIMPLISMSAQCRFALLRRWISMQGASTLPSRATLSRIWDEVALARKDAMPCLRLHNHTIRRFRGHLWFVMNRLLPLRGMVIRWFNIYNALILPYSAGCISLTMPGNIRFPFSSEIVSIRFGVACTLHIVGRNGGRKLKKIWQEYNVPPWLRSTIPLLFYNEKLIAAAGFFITKDGWTENGMQLIWNKCE